jgi:hypothetical protein
MFNEEGEVVTDATPSLPVVVLGLSGTPNAGEEVIVLPDERKAREVALHRQGKFRDVKLAKQTTKMEDVFSQLGEGQVATLNLLIKADVQGSAEALRDALTALSVDDARVKVIASGVGGISESDVNLAAASQATIIGFNVRADGAARISPEGSGRSAALPQHHLRSDRPGEACAQRHAGTGNQGADRRPGRGARCIPLTQVRQRGRLHGSRRLRQTQPADSRVARQRRDLRGRARVSAPVQG